MPEHHSGSPKVRLTTRKQLTDLQDASRFYGALDWAWCVSVSIAVHGPAIEVLAKSGRVPDGKSLWDASPRNAVQRVGRPSVRFSQQSPHWVEMAGDIAGPVSIAGLAWGMFVYVIRHPDEIGGVIPRLVAGWHENWTRVAEAKIGRLDAETREHAAYNFRQIQDDLEGEVNDAIRRLAEHQLLTVDAEGIELPDLEPPTSVPDSTP